MIIQTISDTHCKHKEIKLKDCDLIIHAGDFSSKGTSAEAKSFLKWYAKLPYKHKVLVPGNHDIWCERDGAEWTREFCKDNAIKLLINKSAKIDGLKIWGSPATVRFGYGWGWNKEKSLKDEVVRRFRGIKDAEFIGKVWNRIPNDVDIVVCHQPCYGILDNTTTMKRAGCPLLKDKIFEIKPKLFVCGHFHEGRGQVKNNETLFVNTAICDERYNVQEPFLFAYG